MIKSWQKLPDNSGQLIEAWVLETRAGTANMTAKFNVKGKYYVTLNGFKTTVSNWEDAETWVINTTNQIVKQKSELQR